MRKMSLQIRRGPLVVFVILFAVHVKLSPDIAARCKVILCNASYIQYYQPLPCMDKLQQFLGGGKYNKLI